MSNFKKPTHTPGNRWATQTPQVRNPTVAESTEVELDTSNEPMVREAQPPVFRPVETDGSDLSVGLSIGRSADYGKNKYTISIRTTIPCMNNDESRTAAAELGRDICVTRIQEIEDEIIELFNLKGIER